MDEIQAAVLDIKLKYLDEDNQKRRKIAHFYLDNIKNPLISLPRIYDENAHVWHIFAVRTSSRDKLQKYLAENNIQTLIHYPIPPHKQACYKEWNDLNFPITEKIHREILSLPISPVLTVQEAEFVADIINNYKES